MMMILIYAYRPAWRGAVATLVFVARELRGISGGWLVPG